MRVFFFFFFFFFSFRGDCIDPGVLKCCKSPYSNGVKSSSALFK